MLILVASTDLGSALIFFLTYLLMLYVATRDWRYLAAGLLAGALAAVVAYFLFSHVRVRVQIWQDPFASYTGDGYQVAQSLFSIAAGGWFGTGLYQGSPTAIPIVEQDFMFSAIAEELGGLFAMCVILICMSCFIMIVNIAMKMEKTFYKLTALGLGCTYAVQVFLTVGCAMKMIPMTGVTFPLISYGGSSIMSTVLMFAIVQGFYISRREKRPPMPYYGGYPPYPDQGYYPPYGAPPYGNPPYPNDGYDPYSRQNMPPHYQEPVEDYIDGEYSDYEENPRRRNETGRAAR